MGAGGGGLRIACKLRVSGFGFRVQGSRVEGRGWRVRGSRFRSQDSRFGVQVWLGFRVSRCMGLGSKSWTVNPTPNLGVCGAHSPLGECVECAAAYGPVGVRNAVQISLDAR